MPEISGGMDGPKCRHRKHNRFIFKFKFARCPEGLSGEGIGLLLS